MPPLWEIVRLYWQSLGNFFLSHWFWLVLLLIGLQFRRMERIEKAFVQTTRWPLAGRIFFAALFGLAGGAVGSLLLMGLGIPVAPQGIQKVLLVSLALALINMRYICFAYSGGLVSLVSLIFGWPALDIASLLALVAVLHAVESVLIFLSGHLQAFPVTVRQPSGRLVGGYNMQMFWPLPLLALVFVPEVAQTGSGIAMPSWWPLLVPPEAAGLAGISLMMMPLLVGLGYGDLAVTMTPKQKARHTSLRLLVYSGLLFVLAWAGSREPALLPLAAIFAPLGHESLILIANRQEERGEPLFCHQGPGVKIMEVLPGGLAGRSGLASGDIIRAANGQELDTMADLIRVVETELMAVLTVIRDGRSFSTSVALPVSGGSEQLGIIPVPDGAGGSYVESRNSSPLQWVIDRIRNNGRRAE